MAPKKPQKVVTAFDFLSPLDGNTYTLPPYQQALFVDQVTQFQDTLPEIPDPWTMLTKLTPTEQDETINTSQRRLSQLRTMSVLKTFDAHITDADDPAKKAIVACVNAAEFAFLFKLFGEWIASAGEKVEDEPGED